MQALSCCSLYAANGPSAQQPAQQPAQQQQQQQEQQQQGQDGKRKRGPTLTGSRGGCSNWLSQLSNAPTMSPITFAPLCGYCCM